MIELNIHKKMHGAEGDTDLSLEIRIQHGEFISLSGKSGAGKTTFLKILAGLVQPERGSIKVNGEYWLNTEDHIHVVPQKRNIGYLFQDYALFPNMTVKENLSFVQKDSKRVQELLDITELGALQHRYPNALSGGQQQRVALARAVARNPSLLLLDEPLSAIDQEMRYKLQEQLKLIHKHFQLTTILVTHDIAEMYALSDRVIEIANGRITKTGTPSEVFNHRSITGKIQLTGKILAIEPSDALFIATILAGTSVFSVVVTPSEAMTLQKGDQVQVIAKAFSPLLIKIDASGE